ncbi:MAG TPA: hypothetical protein VEA44_18550 [Caulobacter sp.]|nr:hypothetical protein [Caulobacter sp.]
MAVVTVFSRKSNLSKLVDASGGVTVLAGLRGADRETAEVRSEGRGVLLAAIAALEAAGAAPAGDAEAWLDSVYGAAADIIDVCPAELPGLYKAVHGLCELSDLQRRAGRLDRPPVEVHIAALRPLSQPGQDPAAMAPILAGLEALLAREAARGG